MPNAGQHYIDYVVEVLGESTHAFTFEEPASVVASNNFSCTLPAGPEYFSGDVAEGNIRTTPDDLSHWIRALLRGKAGIDHDTITQMEAVEPTGEGHQYFGLGIVYTEGLGYGHNGGHPGLITVMRYNPLTDVTIVMFMSVIDFSSPAALTARQFFMYDAGRKAVAIVTR